ncbi:MAG: cation:proton antiporter subunit C [Candidatus Altiarchaeota archaeon]
MIQTASFMTAGALIAIGLFAVVFIDNMIKKVMGLVFISDGVNLVLIAMGYREGGIVPILTPEIGGATFTSLSAYPLTMALVLTAIVISVSTITLILGLCIKAYCQCNSLSARKMWGEG